MPRRMEYRGAREMSRAAGPKGDRGILRTLAERMDGAEIMDGMACADRQGTGAVGQGTLRELRRIE